MATNSKIKSDIQQLNIDSAKVSLYVLDASSLGGATYYFTSDTDHGSPIVFNGITYLPLPVEITGMELLGDGRLPRPHLKVANVFSTFVALVNDHFDGVGTKLTRLRTFEKYLDGHAAADANAQFPVDVFYCEQKVYQDNTYIEWEFVSPVDFGNRKLPAKQVISYCPHRYRTYANGSFRSDGVTCPYTGTDYYDATGVPVTAALDKCGKKLSDCELRFPKILGVLSQNLPFKGFPGIGQLGRAYR